MIKPRQTGDNCSESYERTSWDYWDWDHSVQISAGSQRTPREGGQQIWDIKSLDRLTVCFTVWQEIFIVCQDIWE